MTSGTTPFGMGAGLCVRLPLLGRDPGLGDERRLKSIQEWFDRYIER